MIKKGTKVKVEGFPDATGVAYEDEEDGQVLVYYPEEDESGMSYHDVADLTVLAQ